MLQIVVDTTSDVLPEEAKKLGILSLPLKLSFDSEVFTPGVDMTNEEFYDKLKNSKVLPRTSQLNSYDYLDVIKPLIEHGDDVFVMCLSSKMSGSFQSLEQAAKEIDSAKIKIFNTEAVTFAYKALVYEAIKLRELGYDLAKLEEAMQNLKTKVKMFAVVDNVNYLIKGGRLSSAAGFLVKTLHIKPIVKIVDGELKVVAKAIGHSAARKTLSSLLQNMDKSKTILIGHSNDIEKGQLMKSYLEKECAIKVDDYCEVGPIIGTHAGPGCVGIAYFEN